MDKELKHVLKTIIDLAEKDKNVTGVPVTYLSNRLKIEKQRLLEIIDVLRQQGYVKISDADRHVLLVKPTSKSKNQIYFWKRLSFWVSISAIVGAGIACYSFVKQLTLDFQDPSRVMLIESNELKQTINYVGLPADEIPFKDADLVSKVAVYLEGVNVPESFTLRVENSTSDDPPIVDGLKVSLLNYRALDKNPVDVDYLIGRKGGGGGRSVYSVDEFPIPQTIATHYQAKDPLKAIGSSVIAKRDCTQSVESQCDSFRYLTKNVPEDLMLDLSFLKNLPAGWYEFEVAVAYTYRANQQFSQAKRFALVKPETIKASQYDTDEKMRIPGFVQINLLSGEVSSTLPVANLPNPSGFFLTFHTNSGLDNGYFIWDLNSGLLRHVGRFASVPRSPNDAFNYSEPNYTADGWTLASEIEITKPQVGKPLNLDVAMIDLMKDVVTEVGTSDGVSELSPAWSPSGKNLAYVAYATKDTSDLKRGQADVYVYDVARQASRRITFTPDVVEAELTWIDETHLALLIPQFEGWARTTANAQSGVGILDTSTGKVQLISNKPYRPTSELQYLSHQRIVAVLNRDTNEYLLYYLDTSQAVQLKLPMGDRCHLLDTIQLKALCEMFAGSISVYDISSGSVMKLADQIYSEGHLPTMIGTVRPEGFIIADPENETIHQYSEDGTLVRDWMLPGMRQVFSMWWIDQIQLISQNAP
jgi:hypothetical protein